MNTRAHTPTGRDSCWWDGPRRAFGTAATLALIIVSLIGTYLAISSPYGDSGQLATAPMLAAATPDASPEACVGDCSDPSTAFSSVRPVASGFINKPDLSSDDLVATLVQFQDWAIDPGAMIEVPAANGAVTGAVVDIVLDGVAVVTIDAPVVVNGNSDPETAGVQYIPSGTTVELGRGEVISYPAGRARTILNPLSTTLLHFKSAVFYDGDAALTRPNPLPDNLHVRVDDNGVLPYSLARYPNNELAVQLDYVQLFPGASVPHERWGNDRIIGPVDPQAGPAGQEGYILWVGRVMA
jgi:hypothetical protein